MSDDVTLGDRVVIPRPSLVNLYGCTIQDDTKVGAFVEIQKNVEIGQRYIPVPHHQRQRVYRDEEDDAAAVKKGTKD